MTNSIETSLMRVLAKAEHWERRGMREIAAIYYKRAAELEAELFFQGE